LIKSDIRIYLRTREDGLGEAGDKPQQDRRSIARRRLVSEGGTKHEKLAHSAKPGVKIMVPRHGELSAGVARSIAKAAGW